MNIRIYTLLILLPLFFLACEEETQQKSAPMDKVEEETTTPAEPTPAQATPLDTLAELKSLTPTGFEILGHHYGDLNKDELTTDLILILKASDEAETSDMIDHPTPRPLHIYTRQAGSLQHRAQNDQTVLCVDCGGIFGDPYSGIAIKNGYFSVEHYGGSNWRWTKIITYRYHPESDSWRLHKIGEESFHSSVPDEVETAIQSTKDFGVVDFKDYQIYEE